MGRARRAGRAPASRRRRQGLVEQRTPLLSGHGAIQRRCLRLQVGAPEQPSTIIHACQSRTSIPWPIRRKQRSAPGRQKPRASATRASSRSCAPRSRRSSKAIATGDKAAAAKTHAGIAGGDRPHRRQEDRAQEHRVAHQVAPGAGHQGTGVARSAPAAPLLHGTTAPAAAPSLLLWVLPRLARSRTPQFSRADAGAASQLPPPLLRRRAHALPAVQGLHARRARVPVRAHALDQGPLQALRDLPAAARPHAGDGVREGLDAHARVVRGRHEPAGRHRASTSTAATRSSRAASRSRTSRA